MPVICLSLNCLISSRDSSSNSSLNKLCSSIHPKTYQYVQKLDQLVSLQENLLHNGTSLYRKQSYVTISSSPLNNVFSNKFVLFVLIVQLCFQAILAVLFLVLQNIYHLLNIMCTLIFLHHFLVFFISGINMRNLFQIKLISM